MTLVTCDYCGHEGECSGEIEPNPRHGVFQCVDGAACNAREAAGHHEHLKELRRLARQGEELTEAEKQELADVR